MNRRLSTRAACTSVFEQLEIRRLLAQISVTSFGATPNDGRDDLGAIRSAINASANGDTIYFPAGTYNVSDKILLKGGGRSYRGEGGDGTTVLKGDPARHIFWIREDGTRVENLTFDGKAMMIDKPSPVMVADVVINNNVFRHNGSGSDNHAITFTTGLRNSTISNNLFQNSPIAVYGYYWDKLRIANNEFIDNTQGMHIDDHGVSSRDLMIEQNYFSGIRRIGIEWQGGGINSIVQDNFFEKPRLSSNFNENHDTYAYSIIACRSVNMIARRNVIIAPERPDGVGVRIGFEVGGDNTLIEDNWVSGINHVIAANDGEGSTSVLARNNFYENVLQGPVGRGLTQYNNGPNVKVSWDTNRGRPGRNRQFGQPAPAPTPAPTPTPTPTPAPDGTTYLSDLNWASMNNGWGPAEKDRSNGELGGSDGRTLTLAGQTYAKGLGVHAGSEIVYNLNGQYSQFLSDIGIDDEVGNGGSVAFTIYLDNAKVFDSGTITGSSATQKVSLDVTGKQTLKLAVHHVGDGNAYDHADWANARLVSGTAPLPAPTPTNGESLLSNLNWVSASNGWGPVEKNRSNGEIAGNDGRTLTIRDKTYASGLGVHAYSDIKYNLDANFTRFTSDIGIDNETGGRGSAVFQVFVDGKIAYDSGTVRGTDSARQVSVDVTGARELRLVVSPGGDGNAYDHANWAGAKLTA